MKGWKVDLGKGVEIGRGEDWVGEEKEGDGEDEKEEEMEESR